MATPSETIIAAANETATVTDKRGRKLAIQRLHALDRMRLASMVGAANAENTPYMVYATAAFSVASIDGDEVARPIKVSELEFLVKRLDEDGVTAVLEGMGKNFAPQQDEEAEKAEIKNG